jgi:hypothetical protein
MDDRGGVAAALQRATAPRRRWRTTRRKTAVHLTTGIRRKRSPGWCDGAGCRRGKRRAHPSPETSGVDDRCGVAAALQRATAPRRHGRATRREAAVQLAARVCRKRSPGWGDGAGRCERHYRSCGRCERRRLCHGPYRRERRAAPSRTTHRPEDGNARRALYGRALTAHRRCAAGRQRALAAVVGPRRAGRGGRLRRGIGDGGGGCDRRRWRRAGGSKQGADGSQTGRAKDRTTAVTAPAGILEAPAAAAIAARTGCARRCRRGRRRDARSKSDTRRSATVTGRADDWCTTSTAGANILKAPAATVAARGNRCRGVRPCRCLTRCGRARCRGCNSRGRRLGWRLRRRRRRRACRGGGVRLSGGQRRGSSHGARGRNCRRRQGTGRSKRGACGTPSYSHTDRAKDRTTAVTSRADILKAAAAAAIATRTGSVRWCRRRRRRDGFRRRYARSKHHTRRTHTDGASHSRAAATAPAGILKTSGSTTIATRRKRCGGDCRRRGLSRCRRGRCRRCNRRGQGDGRRLCAGRGLGARGRRGWRRRKRSTKAGHPRRRPSETHRVKNNRASVAAPRYWSAARRAALTTVIRSRRLRLQGGRGEHPQYEDDQRCTISSPPDCPVVPSVYHDLPPPTPVFAATFFD